MSSYDDIVSIKARAFGERLLGGGWATAIYPLNTEIYPSCTCNCEGSNPIQGVSGNNENSNENQNENPLPIVEKKQEITVKPNPTTGQLTINSEQLTISSVEVYDVVGQNVGANLRVRPENNEITIDVSHLANGMYFLKIQTENGIVMKKFVKN